MFPTFSKVIKSNLPKSLPNVTTLNFLKIAFIVLNVITGFIAATTFFITGGIQKHFNPLKSIISTDYEYYLQIAIVLAFVAVVLSIYGCHCADIESIAATTAYLVLTSILFVGYLMFVLFFTLFKEHIPAIVDEKFDNYERKEAIVMSVDEHLQQLKLICCIIIGCQLVCKIIGTKFLSDMQKEQRAISISYILNDIESSKQTFMVNQKV